MMTDPRKACANKEERLLWALIHDGIAHPLMAITLFSGWSVAFHDWTSQLAWPRSQKPMFVAGSKVETLSKEAAFDWSAYLRAEGIPHVTRSIPLGAGLFQYEVERLA